MEMDRLDDSYVISSCLWISLDLFDIVFSDVSEQDSSL